MLQLMYHYVTCLIKGASSIIIYAWQVNECVEALQMLIYIQSVSNAIGLMVYHHYCLGSWSLFEHNSEQSRKRSTRHIEFESCLWLNCIIFWVDLQYL